MAQSPSPADITAVQDVLKEVYVSDDITSQINEDCLAWSRIDQSSDHEVVGDKAIGFIKLGHNKSGSARSLNGGTLGAARHIGLDRWEMDYTAQYNQVKILGTTIAKMASARQSAVRAIDLEVNGAMTSIKRDLQRQIYGNGDALIIQCGTTSASTTVVLNTTLGYDALKTGFIAGSSTNPMAIDIGTTASEDSVVADALVTGVTASTTAPTITIDSSVTTSSSHYISVADNRDGTTSYEMNGLQNLVDDAGTFMAIDSSSVTEWKSKIVDANSTPLTRSYMQEAWRGIAQYGDKPNLILTSLEQQEYYYDELQAQVRFANDKSLASGNVDGPLFRDVPVVADPDCPRGDMYFLNTKRLFMASAGKIEWQNVNTGGDILAWVQSEDAFVARLAYYGNLGTERRRSHARIQELTP